MLLMVATCMQFFIDAAASCAHSGWLNGVDGCFHAATGWPACKQLSVCVQQLWIEGS